MEVGWHLRLCREDAFRVLVQAKLAPNVEDAVFIAGDWVLSWEPSPEADGFLSARLERKTRRG